MTASNPAVDRDVHAPWEPPVPQLIRNARMMIVGYRANLHAIAALLPPGLEPHPNGRVQMNMYEVEAHQTSGFGAFSLTYLSLEVAGHDSELAEGAMAIPGRYFAYYWNSSARVRAYVRERVGAKEMPGVRTIERAGNALTSTLNVDGRDVIRLEAQVGDKVVATLGGHLNYYAQRKVLRADGSGLNVHELLELPLPFVADAYEASVQRIDFDFPEGHPAAALRPQAPLETPSVLCADVTFTYSIGRVVRDYLAG